MKFLLAVMAAFALCAPAHAQRLYSQAELDALLAPIALQTDGVLSQVLMAATYPEDVAAAAAWSRANAHLRGDAAVRAADEQPWDPSVKSLLAFPELLARMDESPQWLRDLGEAFLGQQAQVMDTVQGLRQRAQANGQLVTSADTAVYQQGEAIVVQPRAQVVYVPYYDPYVVYGPWWWGPYYRPVVWRAWSPYPVFLAHGFFYSAPDWRHRHVRVVHRPVHVHRHHEHIVPGKWQHRAQVQRVQTPAALSRPVRDRVQPQVQPQARPQSATRRRCNRRRGRRCNRRRGRRCNRTRRHRCNRTCACRKRSASRSCSSTSRCRQPTATRTRTASRGASSAARGSTTNADAKCAAAASTAAAASAAVNAAIAAELDFPPLEESGS